MAKINRESIQDAQKIVEKFLPEVNSRTKFINFLGNAINFANSINCDNWNLNLDLYGQFLRFNVGHEFCIELTRFELLILCDRTSIKTIINQNNIPVTFRGYIKGIGDLRNTNIDQTPDLLAKTKNNVGCIIKHQDIVSYIDYFISSNRDFIKAAMNTHLMPIMRKAHSIGAVEYVFSFVENTYNTKSFKEIDEITLRNAKIISQEKRLQILEKSNKKPLQITVKQTVFQRNPYVIAEALFRANGHCEKCKKPAPFIRDHDNSPYLEVHHITTLADGGDDTIENVIALCPNCHRHAHYGTTTY